MDVSVSYVRVITLKFVISPCVCERITGWRGGKSKYVICYRSLSSAGTEAVGKERGVRKRTIPARDGGEQ